MDDFKSPGEMVGEIGGVAKNTAKTVGGELKSIGKSAISQIGGTNKSSNQSTTTTQAPDTSSDSSSSGKHYSLLAELKKVGQTAGSQIFGGQAEKSDEEVSSMKKKDEEFSKTELESIRGKVDQIYREHAQRRAAEEQKKKDQALKEMEEKRRRREEIRQLEKKEPVNPAVAKTRAEIKNYGAE